MTPEIPEWLDEVEKRCEAATPGPYIAKEDIDDEGDDYWCVEIKDAKYPENCRDLPDTEQDCHFYVSARTDIPLLLAYCRRLREMLQEVKEYFELKDGRPSSYIYDIEKALNLTLEDLKHES